MNSFVTNVLLTLSVPLYARAGADEVRLDVNAVEERTFREKNVKRREMYQSFLRSSVC